MTERHGKAVTNPRNCKSHKTVQSTVGDLAIKPRRNRDGSLERQPVKKRHVRLAEMEEKILALYAEGLCTHDIESTLKDMYGVTISCELIADVTDAVLDEVRAWQTRPLEATYPIIWLGVIVIKVRHGKQVVNTPAHVVLSVNGYGEKEVLGLWLAENEGARFWLWVLSDLHQRGVQDIYVTCLDDQKGLPEAVKAIFPQTLTQLCIVHLVRASLHYVMAHDSKAVAAALKRIYRSATAEDAARELAAFEADWGKKYMAVVRLWRGHWDNITPFFQFLPEIRKVIYTSNAVKSLSVAVRKYTRNGRIFPNDDAALKTLLLVIRQASKNWKAINPPPRQNSCQYFL